jgi:hypothetical protein
VRSTFNDLQLNADPVLGQLFTYFNDQWLTRIPVPMWNVYRAKLRTNNDLEGWHNRFSNLVLKHYPNIWHFILFLNAEHDATFVTTPQLLAGQAIQRRFAPQEAIEKRLRKLCRRYRHGHIGVVDYITAVSYNIAQFQ